jgi:hypothetical protein
MGPPRPPGGAKGCWMTVEDVIGQQPKAAAAADGADGGDDAAVAPPRPPAGAVDDGDADDGMVGPLRPPADGGDDEDTDMVGPPRPPGETMCCWLSCVVLGGWPCWQAESLQCVILYRCLKASLLVVHWSSLCVCSTTHANLQPNAAALAWLMQSV